ncbi:Seryl-tRNA synthetase [Methanonatronarchaeum thermophilum]|uniref:Serine--tRNA ligase n=1 Tax=Methanonatronarchaeum thermophilum TaxID=1927129 RepID=A0A1Y3GBL2_9EURY|nr:serine--tRNA ligase [Methanonatronarchaeum thermophilum]OUJ18630.1 Seryl-tRNA synthetase [Methanonatronarchaeum thermophilum]
MEIMLELKLKGKILLSDTANQEVTKDINKLLKTADQDILKKGAPEKMGATIKNWNVIEDQIEISIKSNRYVRAHEALIRLINPLSNKLGPKHHIGVRGIEIKEYQAHIKQELTEQEKKRFKKEMKNLRWISKIETKEGIKLHLTNLSESDIRNGVIDRLLKLTNEVITDDEEITYKVSEIEPGTTIKQSEKRELKLKTDPTTKASEKGWIKKFPGKGQWIYMPPYTKLFNALSELAKKHIPEKTGFNEAMFPKLIPLSIMNKMKYLEGLPEGMYYTSNPKRDDELYSLFKKELKILGEPPVDILEKGLKKPGYVLAPAQCEPFYQMFTHEMLSKENLPIKLYDNSGFTYRWEGGGSKGLDRVNEFQRNELVWIGKPKQTEKVANQVLDAYIDFIDKYIQPEWHIEVGDDPFYLEGRHGELDDIEYPDIPKREIRVKMPGNEEGLSIGSVNLHGTHFVKGFSIRSPYKEPLWTGCAGLGLSRWVIAFLAYNGFNPENWPKEIKNKTQPLPETPYTLEWP